jgi:plasmid maintenance system antidote protein VapI
MKLELDKLKGIHPGILVGHLLKKNSIKKKDFSLLVNEHPQTLSAIILGRRAMNTTLSMKIEKEFGLSEGLSLKECNDLGFFNKG